MPSPSSVVAALLAACLAGCEAPYPEHMTDPVDGPSGSFFAWEQDPRGAGLLGTLGGPNAALAVGATLHVGYAWPASSWLSCVESLVPAYASSDCGELIGDAPGWTRLLAMVNDGRLLDDRALRVAEPTDLDLAACTRSAGRTGCRSEPVDPTGAEPVAVPFFGDAQVLVLPRGASGAQLGVVAATLEVDPPGALAIDSYGRYFRLVCLRTGDVEARFSFRGASALLTLDCREPADGDGAP